MPYNHGKAVVSLEPAGEGVVADLLIRRSDLLIYCKTLLLSLIVIRCYFAAAMNKNRGFPRGRAVAGCFFVDLSARSAKRMGRSQAPEPPPRRVIGLLAFKHAKSVNYIWLRFTTYCRVGFSSTAEARRKNRLWYNLVD